MTTSYTRKEQPLDLDVVRDTGVTVAAIAPALIAIAGLIIMVTKIGPMYYPVLTPLWTTVGIIVADVITAWFLFSQPNPRLGVIVWAATMVAAVGSTWYSATASVYVS